MKAKYGISVFKMYTKDSFVNVILNLVECYCKTGYKYANDPCLQSKNRKINIRSPSHIFNYKQAGGHFLIWVILQISRTVNWTESCSWNNIFNSFQYFRVWNVSENTALTLNSNWTFSTDTRGSGLHFSGNASLYGKAVYYSIITYSWFVNPQRTRKSLGPLWPTECG